MTSWPLANGIHSFTFENTIYKALNRTANGESDAWEAFTEVKKINNIASHFTRFQCSVFPWKESHH